MGRGWGQGRRDGDEGGGGDGKETGGDKKRRGR